MGASFRTLFFGWSAHCFWGFARCFFAHLFFGTVIFYIFPGCVCGEGGAGTVCKVGGLRNFVSLQDENALHHLVSSALPLSTLPFSAQLIGLAVIRCLIKARFNVGVTENGRSSRNFSNFRFKTDCRCFERPPPPAPTPWPTTPTDPHQSKIPSKLPSKSGNFPVSVL